MGCLVRQKRASGPFSKTCPACMQQAVPDLTSPRVYLSPGGTGAHLSGLNKLFFGYSILDESVLGHGRSIGQEHPGRLKLGLLVLLRALYKVHWSWLKSDIYFGLLMRQKRYLIRIYSDFQDIPRFPTRYPARYNHRISH